MVDFRSPLYILFCSLIKCSVLFSGQIIFSLGGFLFNFPLMQVGRFVFGIGGESLAVAQNTYAVSWFKGKELNMVFGFQLSIARVGSTLNFISMAPLYAWFGQFFNPHVALGWTLLSAGGTFCVMSFICALVSHFFNCHSVFQCRGKKFGLESN